MEEEQQWLERLEQKQSFGLNDAKKPAWNVEKELKSLETTLKQKEITKKRLLSSLKKLENEIVHLMKEIDHRRKMFHDFGKADKGKKKLKKNRKPSPLRPRGGDFRSVESRRFEILGKLSGTEQRPQNFIELKDSRASPVDGPGRNAKPIFKRFPTLARRTTANPRDAPNVISPTPQPEGLIIGQEMNTDSPLSPRKTPAFGGEKKGSFKVDSFGGISPRSMRGGAAVMAGVRHSIDLVTGSKETILRGKDPRSNLREKSTKETDSPSIMMFEESKQAQTTNDPRVDKLRRRYTTVDESRKKGESGGTSPPTVSKVSSNDRVLTKQSESFSSSILSDSPLRRKYTGGAPIGSKMSLPFQQKCEDSSSDSFNPEVITRRRTNTHSFGTARPNLSPEKKKKKKEKAPKKRHGSFVGNIDSSQVPHKCKSETQESAILLEKSELSLSSTDDLKTREKGKRRTSLGKKKKNVDNILHKSSDQHLFGFECDDSFSSSSDSSRGDSPVSLSRSTGSSISNPKGFSSIDLDPDQDSPSKRKDSPRFRLSKSPRLFKAANSTPVLPLTASGKTTEQMLTPTKQTSTPKLVAPKKELQSGPKKKRTHRRCPSSPTFVPRLLTTPSTKKFSTVESPHHHSSTLGQGNQPSPIASKPKSPLGLRAEPSEKEKPQPKTKKKRTHRRCPSSPTFVPPSMSPTSKKKFSTTESPLHSSSGNSDFAKIYPIEPQSRQLVKGAQPKTKKKRTFSPTFVPPALSPTSIESPQKIPSNGISNKTKGVPLEPQPRPLTKNPQLNPKKERRLCRSPSSPSMIPSTSPLKPKPSKAEPRHQTSSSSTKPPSTDQKNSKSRSTPDIPGSDSNLPKMTTSASGTFIPLLSLDFEHSLSDTKDKVGRHEPLLEKKTGLELYSTPELPDTPDGHDDRRAVLKKTKNTLLLKQGGFTHLPSPSSPRTGPSNAFPSSSTRNAPLLSPRTSNSASQVLITANKKKKKRNIEIKVKGEKKKKKKKEGEDESYGEEERSGEENQSQNEKSKEQPSDDKKGIATQSPALDKKQPPSFEFLSMDSYSVLPVWGSTESKQLKHKHPKLQKPNVYGKSTSSDDESVGLTSSSSVTSSSKGSELLEFLSMDSFGSMPDFGTEIPLHPKKQMEQLPEKKPTDSSTLMLPKPKALIRSYSIFDSEKKRGRDASPSKSRSFMLSAPSFSFPESRTFSFKPLSDTPTKVDEPEELSPESPAQLFTWTRRFQECVRDVSSLTIDTRVEDVMRTNTELMHLSDDFVHAARTFGKIIITEAFLPVEKKTIKPRTIGGIVGGEKYIVHSILFKFAFDNDKVFAGDDGAAAKVSDRELKGLMTFFSLDLPGLFFPMMALVRYRGFTLVAMTLLPVDRSTLVYGSHDGGATVHNSNKRFSELMQIAGERLNLQSHLCGPEKGKTVELGCAADIEGHLGFDQNMYLLDFGRAMPPVTPNKKFKNGHIYQLFRPEFVDRYPKRLCSDAYSSFVLHDPNVKTFNTDVDEATKHLFLRVIPDCGKALLKSAQRYGKLGSLVVILHQNGINLRYIGRVIASFDTLNFALASKYGYEMVRIVTKKLLIEATARVIKNQLNTNLRNLMKEVKEPLEVVYRQLTVEFLNVVFGKDGVSVEWWKSSLPEDLQLHFSVLRYMVVENDCGIETPSWRSTVMDENEKLGIGEEEVTLQYALFRRVIELCRIGVSEEGLRKFREPEMANDIQPLDLLDITELGDRVKDMDVVSRTKGVFFQLKAVKESDQSVACSLLLQSIEHFKAALTCMPTNRESLFYSALSWFRYLEIMNTSRRDPLATAIISTSFAESLITSEPRPTFFDLSDPKLQEADELFHRLLHLDDQDAIALSLSGKFFASCHKFELAEECFLRALEADSTSSFAKLSYGIFLYFHGNQQMGLKLLEYAPNLHLELSPLNQLLGSESVVRLEILVEDGSPRHLITPLNVSASCAAARMMKVEKLETGRGVVVEVIKEKHPLEKTAFKVACAKRNTIVRHLETEELPWLVMKKKISLLYFLAM